MTENAERPTGRDLYELLKEHLGDGKIFNTHHLRRNLGDMVETIEFENNLAGNFTTYDVVIDWGEEAGRGHDGATEWRVIDHEFGSPNRAAEQVYVSGVLTGFTGLDEGEALMTRTLAERGWTQFWDYKYGMILGNSATHVYRARSREGWPEYRHEKDEKYAAAIAQAAAKHGYTPN